MALHAICCLSWWLPVGCLRVAKSHQYFKKLFKVVKVSGIQSQRDAKSKASLQIPLTGSIVKICQRNFLLIYTAKSTCQWKNCQRNWLTIYTSKENCHRKLVVELRLKTNLWPVWIWTRTLYLFACKRIWLKYQVIPTRHLQTFSLFSSPYLNFIANFKSYYIDKCFVLVLFSVYLPVFCFSFLWFLFCFWFIQYNYLCIFIILSVRNLFSCSEMLYVEDF